MMKKVDIRLAVNGVEHAVSVEPRRTLADALREDCRLTGTHLGCEHGVCGAQERRPVCARGLWPWAL